MPSISLSGRTYAYEDRGDGLPVLLLHGFPFSSESWWPQLAAPPDGVRFIAVDHRGFGRSDPGDGPATMEAMAEDALALLDALELPSAVVCGLSMGGYVAIALTRLDPGRVRGLVLVDTQSFADDDAGRQRREAVARDVETNGLAGLVETMLPRLLAPGADDEVRRRVESMMRAQSPQAVAAASRGMATRTDGKDILSRYGGPCLVIVGDADVVTPPEKARVLAGLVSGATLEIIPRAGHLTNLEQPAAFGAALERFVARLR
jgi:pimeloyl-ACP methyl ester carboxylesterase